MRREVYGEGGYRPAHPSLGRIELWDGDAATPTVTFWSDLGTQTGQRPMTAAEILEVNGTSEEQNKRTIYDQARQALIDNRAFLDLSSPSNAQVLAQVKALTRQNNKIMRLLLGDTAGTD
jgi:hypothetical protein